jgi:microcystin-dependent protein
MANQYLGQISTFAFNFAPKGWALCNGQILSISQNEALFSLIGTFYGGNGLTTFQLPNLMGRVPVMTGGVEEFVVGQIGGEETHTLILNEIPAHTHGVVAEASPGSELTAPGNFPAVVEADAYSTGSPTTSLGTGMTLTGQSEPHENTQPYLVVNYCIALDGIFPARN